ncbi:HipA domain-containing protein [uncultured Helicobacter sp.]|uniref:HipA domain-containing protein n=1 Tax=uncultured Helicobacter sp. TaxID=175537 RepID=UPI0037504921
MDYILKNKDKEVLRFSVKVVESRVQGSDEPTPSRTEEILQNIVIADKNLLPLGLDTHDVENALTQWIQKRKVPKNREFVEKIVATYVNAPQKLMDYVNVSLALSLNDSYWIVPADGDYRWQDYNLYHNTFSKALELAAFGVQDYRASGIETSPEYTTNGMLKKCWHREDSTIYLYKGSSRIYHKNAEAFSEYYMAQVAHALGFECVSYDLREFHNDIVSACPIFTSENEGYVPMHQCLQTNRSFHNDKNALIGEIIKVYDKAKFQDMMLFDALIGNTDRHLGNFGMIIDNNTNALLRPAPIFDNGLSLMTTITPTELHAPQLALNRITTYFDLGCDEQLGYFVQKRHLQALENLSTFTFTKHPRYNLPDSVLEPINAFLNARALKAITMFQDKTKTIAKTQDTPKEIKNPTNKPKRR